MLHAPERGANHDVSELCVVLTDCADVPSVSSFPPLVPQPNRFVGNGWVLLLFSVRHKETIHRDESDID